MKHNRSILTQLLLSQLIVAPLVPATPNFANATPAECWSAQPSQSVAAPVTSADDQTLPINLGDKNLSLLDVPADAQVTMGNNCSLIDSPLVGCDDNTGPQTAPRRIYDFTKGTLGTKQTRAAVILNQVYNTIEPQTMWTNSTAALASAAAITISSPGKYILTGDLQINAQNTGVIGIKITSSNVTLDLNGYTISQSSGSINKGVIDVVGIYVTNASASLYNITIQNGQLNNIGDYSLNGTGMIIGEGTLVHSGITLDTVRITACGATGIKLNLINDATISNVSVTGCSNDLAGVDLTTYGLNLTTCNNITVRNASFSNLNTTANLDNDATTYGIYVNQSTNLTFTNCATNNNAATVVDSPALGRTYGAYIYSNDTTNITYNIAFTNCTASNNKVIVDTLDTAVNLQCAGFTAAAAATNRTIYTLNFTNCTANNNTLSGTGTTSLSVTGFQFSITKNILLQNCLASYNNYSANTVCGCYFENSQNALIQNCTLLGQSAGSGVAAGIFVLNDC